MQKWINLLFKKYEKNETKIKINETNYAVVNSYVLGWGVVVYCTEWFFLDCGDGVGGLVDFR